MRQTAPGPFRAVLVLLVLATLLSFVPPAFAAADTLPSQLSDAEFWSLVTDLSEPDSPFPYENFVSNEISYQTVIPQMKQVIRPGGVYLGVAPDQNFTYVAALEPKIAFIIDIRRQNMLELLMYKALFEIAPERVEFLSRLFSRPRPGNLSDASTLQEMFERLNGVRANDRL